MTKLAHLWCSLLLSCACASCDATDGAKSVPAPSGTPVNSTSREDGMRSPFAPKPDGPNLGPGPEQHAVGSQARARDYAVTVHGAAPCDVEPHLRPKAGTIKLGVEIEVEGLSEREVPANALYAALHDSENEKYSATLAGCAPVLRASRVNAGKRARGLVTFDVPEGVRGLVMTYEPFIVGSATQKLEFSLGR
jgi:hypothetical protein